MTILNIGIILGLAFAVLFLMFVIGHAATVAGANSPSVTDRLFLGLLIWVGTTYVINSIGLNALNLLIVPVFGLIISAVYLVKNFIKLQGRKKLTRSFLSSLSSPLTYLTIFVGLWPVILPVFWLSLAGASGSIVSPGNNDFANFGLGVKSLLSDGFSPSELLSNVDMATFAAKYYPTAYVFIELFSSISSNGPMGGLFPALIAANSIFGLSLYTLAKETLDSTKQNFLYLFAPTAAGLLPLQQYMSANYFLAQILGMATLAVNARYLLRVVRLNQINLFDQTLIAGFAIFGLVTYPPIGLVTLIAGLTALSINSARFRRTSDILLTAGLLFASAFFFGKNLSVFLEQTTVLAGWPFIGFNAFGSMFWAPFLSIPVEKYVAFLTWLLAVLALFLSVGLGAWKSKINKAEAISIVVSTIAIILIEIKLGPDTYQGWKLVSYVLPMIVTYALVINFRVFSSKVAMIIISPFLIAAIMTPVTIWGPVPTNPNSGFWNGKLHALSTYSIFQTIDSLNIQLGPYAETMMAAAEIPVQRITLAGQSYHDEMLDLETCTLVPSSLVFSQSMSLNSNYSLVPFPTRCSGNPDIKMDKKNPQVQTGRYESLSEIYFWGWTMVGEKYQTRGSDAVLILDSSINGSEKTNQSTKWAIKLTSESESNQKFIVWIGEEPVQVSLAPGQNEEVVVDKLNFAKPKVVFITSQKNQKKRANLAKLVRQEKLEVSATVSQIQ